MKEEIPAISFLSAGKRFEQNNTSFDVLSRVTGHIQKGSITALIGPSGAGKSTLLSLCNLMNTPDEGEVLVFGKEIRRWDIRELRKTAGLAFQSAPVTEGTVRDNLLLAEKLHGRSTIPLKSSQILQTFRAGFWIGMRKNYPEVSGRNSH